MPSQRQKNAGYLLPETITGHQLQCVSLMIPRDSTYVAAFVGKLYELARYWSWERPGPPGNSDARDAAQYWLDLIENTLTFDDCDLESSGCIEFAPNAAIIQWFPNDPFLTPDLVPDGYFFPPWYVAPGLNLIGASFGDVVTDFARITAIAGWSTQYDVPRFRISIEGMGVVELHLVNVFQGGLAVVQLDTDTFSSRFVDLHRDITSSPSETNEIVVIEVEITTPGQHVIDVSIVPRVDDSLIPFGFGGGLRKVVLCGFDTPPPEVEGVPTFRFQENNCQLQYSTNDGLSWLDVPGWNDFAMACFTGAAGEPGAPGAPGENCDCGDEISDEIVPDSPLPISDGARCGIAKAVSETMLDTYFRPTLAEYGVQIAQNGIGTQLFIQNLWQYVTILAGAFVIPAAFYNLLNYLTASGYLDIFNETDTADFRQKAWCALYCALVEEDTNSITGDVKDLWIENLHALTGVDFNAHNAFADFLSGLSRATLRGAALQAAENVTDCEDCGCGMWCYTWNLDQMNLNLNWTPGINPGDGVTSLPMVETAVYVQGAGWRSVRFNQFNEPSDPESYCVIDLILPAATIITNIDFQYSANSAYFEIIQSPIGEAYNLPVLNTVWDGEMLMSEIRFGVRKNDPNRNSTATLTGITLRGTGVNPFGPDNCIA
jgi:hypothetical protein